MFKQATIEIHRWLGIVLSVVFVLWFVSGIVMVFEHFPKVNKDFQFEKAEVLNHHDVIQNVPEAILDNASELSLVKIVKRPYYHVIDTMGKTYFLDASNLEKVDLFEAADLDTLVKNIYGVAYREKIIINDFDQWIPWSRYSSYFPIHKYYLDDSKHTVVYMSQKTASVVQETTRYSRWMARIGAIPHWFYYKSLRLKKDLWVDFVVWLALFTSIAALSGIIVGFIKQKRKKHRKGIFGFSPYKKQWMRWHHITGYIFGIFVLTFSFSGLMSLYDVPQWVIPVHKVQDYSEISSDAPADYTAFDLSVDELLKSDTNDSSIKKIVWKQIGTVPYYAAYSDGLHNPLWIQATSDTIAYTTFSQDDFLASFANRFPDVGYDFELLSEGDNYMSPTRVENKRIVKLKLADANATWLYFDLDKYSLISESNKNTRLRRWLYNGLHSFDLKYLKEHEWLRMTLLIILCVFGTIISVSGLVLAYDYLKKMIRRMRV